MNKKLKIILLYAFGFGFGVFFSPVVIYGVFNIGNIAGMLAFGLPFLAVLFNEKLRAPARRFLARLPGKITAAALAVCLLTGGVWAGVTGGEIVRAAKNAPPEGAAPTVVALGCRVYDSGPSLMLWARINAVYEYLTAHPGAVCILAGGQGEDEPVAEAQSMFEALTERGVDPARLYPEDRSTSTAENLAFAMEIIEEKGLSKDIVLITNEYHQRRASLMAKTLGYGECWAVSAPSQKILLPTYFLREIFGIAYWKLQNM